LQTVEPQRLVVQCEAMIFARRHDGVFSTALLMIAMAQRPWTAVELPDGRAVFVASDLVRSPIEYRAEFRRIDGRSWQSQLARRMKTSRPPIARMGGRL
jgi:hypothetical protein